MGTVHAWLAAYDKEAVGALLYAWCKLFYSISLKCLLLAQVKIAEKFSLLFYSP